MESRRDRIGEIGKTRSFAAAPGLASSQRGPLFSWTFSLCSPIFGVRQGRCHAGIRSRQDWGDWEDTQLRCGARPRESCRGVLCFHRHSRFVLRFSQCGRVDATLESRRDRIGDIGKEGGSFAAAPDLASIAERSFVFIDILALFSDFWSAAAKLARCNQAARGLGRRRTTDILSGLEAGRRIIWCGPCVHGKTTQPHFLAYHNKRNLSRTFFEGIRGRLG